ncbi:MAG TPA: M13 family metallopeptidase [Longimicrobium sp.]|jgi:putative endopeptidase
MTLRRPLASVVMLAALLALPAAAQRPGARALDPADRDTTCSPCRDFYQWANGGWLARNSIPAAYTSWGSFDEIRDRNQAVLRALLEEAARGVPNARIGSSERKLGVFYTTCMDSARAEREGAQPLAEELARIDAIGSRAALQAVVARLQQSGTPAIFNFGGAPDLKDSERVIAVLAQGGLGLPDRDFYTRRDSVSQRIRAEYRAHVGRMLVLAGRTAAQAQAEAGRVVAIETALAGVSMTRVQQRDPHATYHKMPLDSVQALTPNWGWGSYLRARGVAGVDSINVRQPEFFRALDRMLATVPLEDWKAYLRWHYTRSSASALSSAFLQEGFRMQQVLTGTTERHPRWRRCLAAADVTLGDALGQAYVRRTFAPEARERAMEMVDNLGAALRERLDALEWMSDSTRTEALAKLASFRSKIGYPDRWRDYAGLDVRPGSHLDNVRRAQRWSYARSLARIGRRAERDAWLMSAPSVNAYYNPSLNEIVFPAGILQPPFFDAHADDAVNYGGMGAVIGHEMAHGFDDQGRRFDASGNLRDWWTARDAAAFREQAKRVAEQFSQYMAVDTVRINGQLTVGENIADLGGLTIAFHALQKELAGKPRTLVDGLTPEQRFFMAWAQIWRRNTRPETLRLQVATDQHAPSRWRTNGPLSNMPEFARAFGCRPGDPMVRPDSVRARIW